MQLPQIRLSSTSAQISLTPATAKQEIRQPRAEQTIEQQAATLSVQTTRGKLRIDQTRAWEDMNRMGIMKRSEAFAQQGLSDVLVGMERRAREGTELMQIENGGNPVVNHALQNGHTEEKRLGIEFIPSPFSVDISYEPANVEIDWQVNKPVITSQTGQVEHEYRPGQVEIQMERYQALEIDYVHLFEENA